MRDERACIVALPGEVDGVPHRAVPGSRLRRVPQWSIAYDEEAHGVVVGRDLCSHVHEQLGPLLLHEAAYEADHRSITEAQLALERA